MPNQTIPSQNKSFETLYQLNQHIKDYLSNLKEIQALEDTVIYFIGSENNPQFKEDIKAVHSTLYASYQIQQTWINQLDQQLNAVSEIKATDNPMQLIQAIFYDLNRLNADAKHLINLVKVACTEILHINPINFTNTNMEIGAIQFLTYAIERITTYLQSNISSQCGALAESYPTIFKVEV